jgi:hypothetical protein
MGAAPRVGSPAPHVQAALARTTTAVQPKTAPARPSPPSPPPQVQPRAPLPLPGTGPRPIQRPPVQGPIQPYSNAKKGGVNGLLSENGNYFVGGGNLYVKKGATAPHYCIGPTDTLVKDYGKYEGKSSFLKDCLHTAEEIMGGKTFRYDIPATRSQSRETNDNIGDSDPKNILAAQAVSNSYAGKTNENADPGVGEGYLIVETGNVQAYPYHAAGVVAVDGADRVTLEMFAGVKEANDDERKYPGKFNMYSASPNSFHEAFEKVFDNPITIVIKAK